MKLVINGGKEDEFTVEVVGVGDLEIDKQGCILAEMVHFVMMGNFFSRDNNPLREEDEE